jgi:hypothetical protein
MTPAASLHGPAAVALSGRQSPSRGGGKSARFLGCSGDICSHLDRFSIAAALKVLVHPVESTPREEDVQRDR